MDWEQTSSKLKSFIPFSKARKVLCFESIISCFWEIHIMYKLLCICFYYIMNNSWQCRFLVFNGSRLSSKQNLLCQIRIEAIRFQITIDNVLFAVPVGQRIEQMSCPALVCQYILFSECNYASVLTLWQTVKLAVLNLFMLLSPYFLNS